MGHEPSLPMDSLLASDPFVSSNRIIYTPSSFARSSLIHLQETGTLTALHSHKSERSGLASFLFFMVLSGSGRLIYDGKHHELRTGSCAFIDCQKAYSHETGHGALDGHNPDLWSLAWCHFYGPNMSAIYRKYRERGGQPAFHSQRTDAYRAVLSDLYQIADSADYVRDMRIHEKLSSLLILLMEDAWSEDRHAGNRAACNPSSPADIQQVKEYLDVNYREKITLDDLATKFYINKYYLLTLFKARYGVTVNAYLNQVRVTHIKQQLRFTERTVESLAEELHMEPAYLSRLFKKIEKISPREFRKIWRGH